MNVDFEVEKEKEVLIYLESHPKSDIHQISHDLDIDEMFVLKIVNNLQSKGQVKIDVLPLGNGLAPNSSTLYSARGNFSNSL